MHGKHDILDKIKPLVPQNKKKSILQFTCEANANAKKDVGGRNNNLIISWSQR